jgi:hypothetical protein
MVANVNSPNFSWGGKHCDQVPVSHLRANNCLSIATRSVCLCSRRNRKVAFLQFGPVKLWIDRVPNISHPDIWLELENERYRGGLQAYLKNHGVLAPR